MHSAHFTWPVRHEKCFGLNECFYGQSRDGASSAGGWEVAAGRREIVSRGAMSASAATQTCLCGKSGIAGVFLPAHQD